MPVCVEIFRPAERSRVMTVLQAMQTCGALWKEEGARDNCVNRQPPSELPANSYLQKLKADHELSRRQTRWSDYWQKFTSKRLFRPGKSSVALNRTFAVVLPVAGSVSPCRCAALQCQGSKQQLIFKWTQSTNGSARPVSHLHWWCYDT